MYATRKMNVYEMMMVAFIVIVTGLYIYDITKLTVQSLNEAPACHMQVVCDKP